MSIRKQSPALLRPMFKRSWARALGVLISTWLLADHSLAQRIRVETVQAHANGIDISWSGPKGAYTIERRSIAGGAWEDAVTLEGTNHVLATAGPGYLLRVRWQDQRSLLQDFSLGPYPSAYDIFLRSARSWDTAVDVTNDYDYAAESGYLVMAIARFLHAALDYKLPGGEAERQGLVDIAMRQVERLRSVAYRVVGGGPAFGLDYAWDAGSDGSTNAPYTVYAFQSGLVSLGMAELCRYLKAAAPWHPVAAQTLPELHNTLSLMLSYWTNRYESFQDPSTGAEVGFFWYSESPVDNIAVHNVNALMAMASQIYSEINPALSMPRFAADYSKLFKQRWHLYGLPLSASVYWHYADDGMQPTKRSVEDISHALSTLQFVPFGWSRGWYSLTECRRVETTMLKRVWSGNPARANGFVDGSSTFEGTNEWFWTSAASIGFAANADTSGGHPELFDLARSMLVSGYLTPWNRAQAAAIMDAVRLLSVATLFAHRPSEYLADSQWSMSAGDPLDNASPTQAGGVRFYPIEWSAPQRIDDANFSLVLMARIANAPLANVLIDLPDSETCRVAVSFTYRAVKPLTVGQWTGSSYANNVLLPSTLTEYKGATLEGNVIWMRTTILLDPTAYFDYEPSVPGKNVLLEFSGPITVHRIEATPVAN